LRVARQSDGYDPEQKSAGEKRLTGGDISRIPQIIVTALAAANLCAGCWQQSAG